MSRGGEVTVQDLAELVAGDREMALDLLMAFVDTDGQCLDPLTPTPALTRSWRHPHGIFAFGA